MLLNQAVRANPAAEWPFEHGMAMTIIEQVGQAVEPLLLQTRSFALVASPICRSALSRLVRATFPDVAVISYLEIPATKQTEIVATIGDEVPRLASGPGAPMEVQVHGNCTRRAICREPTHAGRARLWQKRRGAGGGICAAGPQESGAAVFASVACE